MAKSKTTASIKRFGPRYGATVKQNVGELEYLKRNSTKCPDCKKNKVKRVAAGIWYCRNCERRFAGKAYTFSAKQIIRDAGINTQPEEVE